LTLLRDAATTAPMHRIRSARLLLAAALLGVTACRRGPCPPDTELRGSPQAGQQSCEYQDSNGLSVKHGPFIDWHPNGRQRSAGSYDHGKQTGRWTYWDENGRILSEREYRDGQLVEERTP
jgi:hypothetical protein